MCLSVCLSVAALAALTPPSNMHKYTSICSYEPAPEMGGVFIARLLFSDWSQFAYKPRNNLAESEFQWTSP